ncbi:MAG: YeeE/YedE family protein [Planctomycetes bacterium]|jgi:uncharacterized membrane protein YedE/YeeE|nr:YeeE/YedE family protein [Planctomycetota bacterium]MCL4731090.1 YeeE/YedE family protein [Planctomycetota bacterium]
MRNLIACVTGIVFALGLGVSGMTLPSKVIGFLDVTGNWDPSLLFVMGSAIPVYMLAWFWRRRHTPWLGGAKFPKPRADLDWRLFAGATLFGIGWGLAGICPGPAVTILGRPTLPALVFFGSLAGGMLLFRLVDRPKAVTNIPSTAR